MSALSSHKRRFSMKRGFSVVPRAPPHPAPPPTLSRRYWCDTQNKEEGYVVVKVDALPAPVFWEVELYLKSRLYNQPDRTKKKIPTTLRATPEYVTARLISPTMDERGGGGGGRSRGGSNLADSRGAGDSNDRKRSAGGVSRNGVAIGGGHAESGGGGGAGEAGVFHGSKKEAGSRGRSGSGAGSISAASADATAAAVVKGNVDRKEASLKNAVARDGCTAVSGGGRHAEGSCSHGGSNSNGTSSKKNSKRNLIASSGHAVSGSGFSRNSHSSSSSSGNNSSSNSNSNSSRSSSSSAASEVPGSGVRNGVHKTHRHANHPQQHRPTVTAPGRGDPRLKGTLTKAGGLAEGRGGPGGGVQARRNDSSKRWRSSAEGISKNPGGVGMLSHRNNSGVIRSGAVEGWGALSRGGVGQGGGGNHETGWTRGPANQAYREGDPSHKRQRVHDSGV